MVKLRRGGPKVVKPGPGPKVVKPRFELNVVKPGRGPNVVVRKRQDEDPVAAGIERATEAWKKYQANRELDRDAVYGYLQVVFDIVQQWKKEGVANENSLEALKQAELSIRMKPDPYARVIYCTSEAHPKMRSKWATIMQWVARHNENARSFTEFVTKNGGLNKCAYLAADDFKPDWT